jgi:hypothetical protein
MDTDVSYEEAGYLKENLVEEYDLRELSLVTMKKDAHMDDSSLGGNVNFESVDTIVQGQLLNINSEFYDSSLLLDIYKGL